MDASVILINPVRGMVAARGEDGSYVIFELLDTSEILDGDIISHPDFTCLGGETYRNRTRNTDLWVYVQNVVPTLDAARERCFLP